MLNIAENAPENAAAVPQRMQSAQRTTQSAVQSYLAGNGDDYALIEDNGDLPF